jgi:integrase
LLGAGSLVRIGRKPPKLCFDGEHCGEYDDVVKDFYDFLIVEMRMEAQTAKNHCWTLRQFLGAVGKEPKDITREDVRGYLLQHMGNKSESTVNNYLKTLKRFFRDYLKRADVIESFKFKQPEFKEKRVPSKEELRQFYRALPNIKNKAAFLVFASSGWRARELLSTTRKDIDLENRRLYPAKASTSTKKVGYGFFNEEAAYVLSQLLKSKRWKEDERVFPAYRTLEKAWAQAAAKSGVKITPQMLREWFCSEMGRLGVPDRYIDAFCGRVPKSVLAMHYTDYRPETLKEIYDKAKLKVLS